MAKNRLLAELPQISEPIVNTLVSSKHCQLSSFWDIEWIRIGLSKSEKFLFQSSTAHKKPTDAVRNNIDVFCHL